MTEATLDEIERIRRRNNPLWMNIMRIALRCAPEETKRVIRAIDKNDQQISTLLERLIDDPT